MSAEITGDPLRAALDEFVKKNGVFTSVIHLQDGIYTQGPPTSDRRLRCFVQAIADLAGKPLNQLRILDLACYEGHYSIELARHGAQVVGVEIREANISKARFVKEHLGLSNLEFRQDDVRNLNEAAYGRFDVVLCAGFLYHLDSPAVFQAIENICSVCDRLAIFETFVSLEPLVSQTYKGKTYWGNYYIEHDERASSAQKYKDLWASIDNPRSFWLTKPSLCNALDRAGFTSVFVQMNPSLEEQPLDRHTFIAMKGTAAQLILSSPLTDREVELDWTEKPVSPAGPPNVKRGLAFRLSKRYLPQPVKDVIKAAGQKVGLMRKPEIPDWNELLPPDQRET